VTESSHSELDELVPPSLADRIRGYHSAGSAWLRDLPELIAACVDTWDLTLLPAFDPGGDSSWTAPVRRSTGDLAVLQLSVPTPVRHDHVTALDAWAGRGAVRLFAHDPAIRATLTECCVPGTDMVELSPREADDIAAKVLTQLWATDLVDLPDLESLSSSTLQRAQLMEARAVEVGSIVDPGPYREAAAVFNELTAPPDRSVLLHGDFHRRNVLLSHRGWLAIDPVAMAGDPCFDVALFLRQDMRDTATVARVDSLSDRLGLDRHRTRSWLFGLAVQAGSWHLSVGDRTTHDAYQRAASTLFHAT
jgi:streptomycin 6-kinase